MALALRLAWYKTIRVNAAPVQAAGTVKRNDTMRYETVLDRQDSERIQCYCSLVRT